jgi:LytS/YehU family sensor histidine kinase
MLKWFKGNYRSLIVVTLLIGSTLTMIRLKPAYELSRDTDLESRFRIAQAVLVLTLSYLIFNFLFGKWKEYRQLKNAHSQAQLDLLKSKMDPNFFFNTLNNLYGLAIEKSDETAPIILKLSDVMRYTIYSGAKKRVTLTEEIAHLHQYIEIHKIRYKKNVAIDIEEDIGNHEILIAPLLFINLLENAFKHGIESLTDNAFIRMEFLVTGQEVIFTIDNNYCPKEISTDGMGLTNLRQRLKLSYPKKHTFQIEKSETHYQATLKLLIS